MRKLIVVDARGRTSLARVRTQKHDRYLAEEKEDGTIVLTPAVSVPSSLLKPVPDPALAVA